jgi:L-rhamnose mutarotase
LPGVLATISACNIRNFGIFLRELEMLLFAYWKYHGVDFAADAAKMAADPVTRDWWNFTDPCQEPYETLADRTWWADMTELSTILELRQRRRSHFRGAAFTTQSDPHSGRQASAALRWGELQALNERGFDWSRDRSGGNFGFGRTTLR